MSDEYVNEWDMMRRAVQHARRVMSAGDEVASEVADLLPGRLRKCRAFTLKKLKRELRDFNINTGRWKE